MAHCAETPLGIGGFSLQRANNVERGCFSAGGPESVHKQNAKLPVIWEAMMLKWRYCDE